MPDPIERSLPESTTPLSSSALARRHMLLKSLGKGSAALAVSDGAYGSGRHGLVCGFRFRAGQPGQALSLDEALLFLSADGAKFVTGTDVLVDDAQSM